ncbi:MAG: DNA translocase FtsK [Lachnospiraceae bacterium]
MATKKTTGSARKRTTSTTARKTSTKRKTVAQTKQEIELIHEITLIVLFACMIFLFLCNFNIIGVVGAFFRNLQFGLFGLISYILPIIIFFAVLFGLANIGNRIAKRKLISGGVLVVLCMTLLELVVMRITQMESYSIVSLYKNSVEHGNGGGVIGGSIAYVLYYLFDIWGSILLLVMGIAICSILVTQRSLVKTVRSASNKVVHATATESKKLQDQRATAREVKAANTLDKKPTKTDRTQVDTETATHESAISRIKNIFAYTKLETQTPVEDLNLEEPSADVVAAAAYVSPQPQRETTRHVAPVEVRATHQVTIEDVNRRLPESDVIRELKPRAKKYEQEKIELDLPKQEPILETKIEPIVEPIVAPISQPIVEPIIIEHVQAPVESTKTTPAPVVVEHHSHAASDKTSSYYFPPISLLKKGAVENLSGNTRKLQETSERLQACLETFGVKVTVTDIRQGPSVTRFELQPEQGVKVSKIVNLSDDIKLNLAATDIRIEAPIPGKAAIGIEVPNKENSVVAFRDLIECDEFKEFASNLCFAVGKDIGGRTILTDIAKMPHMLIAGSTGSGKSVCINTLIMSVLYKAHPDDVKLIMIDPKVVELSVYNGIPHLLIPVVTDPKKASAALHWGVAEMQDRYQKFAQWNVRDLKGYNAKVLEMAAKGDASAPKKLPQIIIIVDELADLMMVSPGEVEESICRLAQLARAAGIHLIIATQRPSVDVITGLIKANMPSRVAFAVSSGVDSRTILDMNGAEKLLGKGDMLFYPQGYPKPARVQGSFVSDEEVAAVVDFLQNQRIGNVYEEKVEEHIMSISSGVSEDASPTVDIANDRDALFVDAGKFVIDKDKGSIGMLQRVFKIGFNRAARIMDQLADYGVVGEEDGTKPRKILMTMEEFQTLIDEVNNKI